MPLGTYLRPHSHADFEVPNPIIFEHGVVSVIVLHSTATRRQLGSNPNFLVDIIQSGGASYMHIWTKTPEMIIML